MGKVTIVLDPDGGVEEVRLLPDSETRFESPELFRYAGRLWSVIRALDEALIFNPPLRQPGESASAPSGKGR
jgi:hypothetical protein